MKRIIYANINDGFVGLWWYTPDGEVWAKFCGVDTAQQDGDYLQLSLSDNHMTCWSSVLHDNLTDADKIQNLRRSGYRCYERGRVIFNVKTQSYVVICSAELVNNMEFREKIIDAFNLPKGRVDFEALSHYFKHVEGQNPAIDQFLNG